MFTVGPGNFEIKKLMMDEKGKDGQNNSEEVTTEENNTRVDAPPAKPVTASVADLLAAYNQGGVEFVSTSSNNTIPDGVSQYTVGGNDVTVYKREQKIRAQIIGFKPNWQDIIKQLPDLEPVVEPEDTETEGTENSSGVNGEIDEPVSQGGTGDCWILTGVLSLASTETGKQIIKSSISANADGSVTVTFKGVGVSYTISADEIKKHDTDNIKNDAYSNGDNDMLVMELATEKLKADIARGKVTLDVDKNSFEGYNGNGSIEGGYAAQILYFLTGRTSDTYLSDNPRQPDQVNFTEEEIYEIFGNALENGETALTFGIYDGVHTAQLTNGKTYKLALGNGGHALAITNLTQDTVTFVNPWDSTKKYTMSWSEFAKLGVGLVSVTDLNDLEDLIEPDDADGADDVDDVPEEPVIPDDVDIAKYSSDDLRNQGFTQDDIDKYFDVSEDGSYTMKSDITFKYMSDKTVEITTIQELREYCGADSRQKLKDEGFPDELIDKYFKLGLSFMTGKSSYGLDTAKYTDYNVSKSGEDTIINVNLKYGGNITITVKPDGSYTEAISQIEPDDDVETPRYSLEDLKNQGFSQDQIDIYFNVDNDGNYWMKPDITYKKVSATHLRTLREVGETVTITTIEELRQFCGADARQKLKDKGFPDELIDKYFGTMGTIDYTEVFYVLKSEYSGYSVGRHGDNTIIGIDLKDGGVVWITVKPDGSYTEEICAAPDPEINEPKRTQK